MTTAVAWRDVFLERLKATGNVALAVSRAGVTRQNAYQDWLPALRADDLRANGAAAVSVFTAAQARRIDGLLTAAAARQAPTRALLELLAIKRVCRLFPMSLPNARRNSQRRRRNAANPTSTRPT